MPVSISSTNPVEGFYPAEEPLFTGTAAELDECIAIVDAPDSSAAGGFVTRSVRLGQFTQRGPNQAAGAAVHIVRYAHPTDPRWTTGVDTLDSLQAAGVLGLEHRIRVVDPLPGAPKEYVVKYRSTGFPCFRDGSNNPYTLSQGEFVDAGSPQAQAQPYGYYGPAYPFTTGFLVRAVPSDDTSTERFFSATSDGPRPAPTLAAGDANWERVDETTIPTQTGVSQGAFDALEDRVATTESDLVDLENEVLVVDAQVETNTADIATLNTKVAGLASSDRRAGIWNAQTNTIVGSSSALAETTGVTSGSQAAALRGRYYQVQATTTPFVTTATADTNGGASGMYVASMAGVGVGHTVTGPGVPAGTRVVQILSTVLLITNKPLNVVTGDVFTFTPLWNGISQFYEKDLLWCDGFNYDLRGGRARQLAENSSGGSTGPWPSFTTPVTDDVAKMFKATLPDNFRTGAAEYTTDGGITTTIASEAMRSGNVLSAGVTGNKAIGQVGWRLRADAGRPAGPWLFNEAPFTAMVTNVVWQHNNPGITYSAGWVVVSDAAALGGAFHKTNVLGAAATLTVPAGVTQLSLEGYKDPLGSYFAVDKNGARVMQTEQYDDAAVYNAPYLKTLAGNRLAVAPGDVIVFTRTKSDYTTDPGSAAGTNASNYFNQVTFYP